MSTVFVDRQLSPNERLNALLDYTAKVEIDCSVSAKLYYKSGLNMYQQFDAYYAEKKWENAFCVYLKYELLFNDKIKHHPQYSSVPVTIKSVNASNFRIMKPRAAHVKRQLLKQYKASYDSYIDELKAKKKKLLMHEEVNNSTSTEAQAEDTHTLFVNVATYLVDNPTFEIKSEVSFNTSMKITELEKQKIKQMKDGEDEDAGPDSKISTLEEKFSQDTVKKASLKNKSSLRSSLGSTPTNVTRRSLMKSVFPASDESF